MNKLLKAIGALLFVILLTGCKEEYVMSSDDIVTNVLSSNDESSSYYGEGSMEVFQREELIEDALFKEYVEDTGKRKIIIKDQLANQTTTTWNDGKQLVSYEDVSNIAYKMDLSGIELPSSLTQKEQVMNVFEGLQETHNSEIIGDEELLGFDTIHMKLTAKEANGLLGDMEFWIDKQSWFIIKSVSTSADLKVVTEYTKVELNPTIPNETFSIDLPEDATIQSMDDYSPKTGSVEDAEQALGEPFLLINDANFKLEKLEWDVLQGEFSRTELTLYYNKDGIPAFTLSIFSIPKGPGVELETSQVNVRGNKAEYMKDIRNLTWDEDSLRYSILIEHPDLSLEEMLKVTETMKMSSD
ncbi:LolA family protein [Aquibacillus kalidii]|uniref:LolA family protein n=1 Tax=Aquibacillus kalidii TaxID=2762597 RepID=UPI0016489D68|nr:DUF2092 domain-containing protein [Aquibacillus kalidii]